MVRRVARSVMVVVKRGAAPSAVVGVADEAPVERDIVLLGSSEAPLLDAVTEVAPAPPRELRVVLEKLLVVSSVPAVAVDELPEAAFEPLAPAEVTVEVSPRLTSDPEDAV